MYGLSDELINKIRKISTENDIKLYIFGSRARGDYRANSDIDIAVMDSISTEKKYKISIEDVYEIINKMSVNYKLDENKLISNFWDMFVVDALIGNTDRHFGNWGFIKKDDIISFAPVYDCGSSLHPLLSENEQIKLMSDSIAFKNSSYNIASVYTMNNKKIFYHEIFKNPPVDLKEAIKKIVLKIDMEKIKGIIGSTEGLSKTQKEYYFKDILLRKEEILDKSYNEIKN